MTDLRALLGLEQIKTELEHAIGVLSERSNDE